MDYPACYAHVFRLLERVIQTPAGWRAACPAHEDRKRSLSIRRGRDGLLLRCHGYGEGCSFTEVLNALQGRAGGKVSAWPDNGSDRPWRATGGQHGHVSEAPGFSGKVVATYAYADETGEVLYEKVRMEPKDFAFRHRGPDGEERWGLPDGVRRVLYQLPHLILMTEAQEHLPPERRRWVWLLEGEKDVETALGLGLVAVCGDGAAKNLHLTDLSPLRGCKVAIAPDLDAIDPKRMTVPGMEHALQAVNCLLGLPLEVRLVFLPGLPFGQGHDFTDWVNTFRPDAPDESIRESLRAILRLSWPWTPWGPVTREEDHDFLARVRAEYQAEREDLAGSVTRPDHALARLDAALQSAKIDLASGDEVRAAHTLARLAASAWRAAEDFGKSPHNR